MDRLHEAIRFLCTSETSVVDNLVFRLHYKFTVVVLLAFTLLVTARQHIGDPIICTGEGRLSGKFANTFCWIHATYSVEHAWREEVGTHVPYPGITRSSSESGVKNYHAYYQWVCFVLILQSLMFYIPRSIWKGVEGGRARSLVSGLDKPLVDDAERSRQRSLLVEYLSATRGLNDRTFLCYCWTEMLNLANVVGQMFLMDRFLDGHFTKYGLEVLSFSDWDWEVRYDPMVRVFPRMTKCKLHLFGPSGGVEKKDYLCLLPVNIVNEKIFIFLWFWFVLLAALSSLALVYRGLLVVLPPLRFLVLRVCARSCDPRSLRGVLRQCTIGDWMVLALIGDNMDAVYFGELVDDVARRWAQENVALEMKRRAFSEHSSES